MFYRPENGHGLPHNPFNAIVAPRPIGWVSTQNAQGQSNLAPYSFFNAVAYVPPQVMFASTSAKPDQSDTKDTVANIRETGVFCVNMVSSQMQNEMNTTSAPVNRDIDEFDLANIAREKCTVIDCFRVAQSPAALECKMTQIVKIQGDNNFVVFGQVVGIHMNDDCIVDGLFDVTRAGLLARLGYQDYTVVTSTFALARPTA
jgi:flavin reductase (DIM6/NTAB) family NADH-FMN oxidoreductase RutF